MVEKKTDLLFYCWFAICVGIMAFVLHTLGDIGGGDAVVIAILTAGLFFGGLWIGLSIEELIKKNFRALSKRLRTDNND